VGGELEGVVDLFQLTVPFGQFCPYHTTTAPYNATVEPLLGVSPMSNFHQEWQLQVQTAPACS